MKNAEVPAFSIGEEVHDRKHEKYYRAIRRLPPEAAEMVTGLANLFMESDVYSKFRANEANISELRQHLENLGAENRDIKAVMGHFNFPYKKK